MTGSALPSKHPRILGNPAKIFLWRQSVSSRMQGRGGPARAMGGGLRDSFVGHTLTEQTPYGMTLAVGLHNGYYV